MAIAVSRDYSKLAMVGFLALVAATPTIFAEEKSHSSAKNHQNESSVWGNTIICSATSRLENGYSSDSTEKYYFGKSKQSIFSPASADDYGADRGTVYTLGNQTCNTNKFSYLNDGKRIHGTSRDCGTFEINGNTITLTENSRQDNGYGDISTSARSTTIKLNGSEDIKLSGDWKATNTAGTVRGKREGICTIVKGRKIKMKTHTNQQQIDCCIKYTKKNCGVTHVSEKERISNINKCSKVLPRNQCSNMFSREDCSESTIKKTCVRLVEENEATYCD